MTVLVESARFSYSCQVWECGSRMHSQKRKKSSFYFIYINIQVQTNSVEQQPRFSLGYIGSRTSALNGYVLMFTEMGDIKYKSLVIQLSVTCKVNNPVQNNQKQNHFNCPRLSLTESRRIYVTSMMLINKQKIMVFGSSFG